MSIITITPDKHYGSISTDGLELAEKIRKLFQRAPSVCRSGNVVDKILIEYAWTDTLKCILDLGNTVILNSFRLDLTLEEINEKRQRL